MGLSVDRVSYAGNGSWESRLTAVASYFVTVFWPRISVPNIINLIDGFTTVWPRRPGAVHVMPHSRHRGHLFAATARSLVYFAMAERAARFPRIQLFSPARIFSPGDGGAYLIGVFIAALSLKRSNKGAVASVLLVTIVALGVPILDTSFALMRRAFRGFPLFRSDDEHNPPPAGRPRLFETAHPPWHVRHLRR